MGVGYTVSAIAAFVQLVTEGEVRVGDAGEGEELSVLADSLGFIAKIDNVEEMQVASLPSEEFIKQNPLRSFDIQDVSRHWTPQSVR